MPCCFRNFESGIANDDAACSDDYVSHTCVILTCVLDARNIVQILKSENIVLGFGF
jgi:hypothetical protein